MSVITERILTSNRDILFQNLGYVDGYANALLNLGLLPDWEEYLQFLQVAIYRAEELGLSIDLKELT